MSRLLALLFTTLPLCMAQRIEAGVKAGVPVTESFETGAFFTLGFGESGASAARRWTGGAELLAHITRRLGFEFDVLYQRLGFDRLTKMIGVVYTSTSATANSWEFPLLGRLELPRIAGVRPFVSVGPSFRTVSSVSARFTTSYPGGSGGGSANHDETFDNRSHFGGIVGVGAEFRAGPARIAPEVRYTRWTEDAGGDPYLHSQQNQVAVLVGITF